VDKCIAHMCVCVCVCVCVCARAHEVRGIFEKLLVANMVKNYPRHLSKENIYCHG
jgi:hypothetical protein